MPISPPPAIPIDQIKFSAKIDYATFYKHGLRVDLPPLTGGYDWTRKKGSPDWSLTVQDPTPADLRAISSSLENPTLMGLEIAVDAIPLAWLGATDHPRMLDDLFVAFGARFRPEEKALWDYGVRGAVRGRGVKPEPLERRLPNPNEQVIYGHRGELMQAKLYLKTHDQGVTWPLMEHRVRMEVALKRWACLQFGLDTADDLLGYRYRAMFATHFRIVDRAEVRGSSSLSAQEAKRRSSRIMRAWATAGVGKFAVGERPREDSLPHLVKQVRRRSRAQLPPDLFKLMRDQQANAKIGNALTSLQRQMRRR